jgi:predicted signal transduction protein with EAL and GGDEF domain
MVLVAVLVALVSWWTLDFYYQHSVQELVAAGWQKNLTAEAGRAIGPAREVGNQALSLLREQRTFLILAFVFLYCTFFACLGRRLRKIHGALDQYSGRLGIQLPRASGGDELRRLGKRLERMSEEVIAETSALEYQARHDNLTNLPNRALLMARLEAGLAEALEQDEPMSLFILKSLYRPPSRPVLFGP